MYTRRKASCHSLKKVILSFVCMISIPYAIDIICGERAQAGQRNGAEYRDHGSVHDYPVISWGALHNGTGKEHKKHNSEHKMHKKEERRTSFCAFCGSYVLLVFRSRSVVQSLI